MPEEFRVWKADEVTKRRKIEPISELTTTIQDKFSQRTVEKIDRIRLYEQEVNQRRKDAEDLKKSLQIF